MKPNGRGALAGLLADVEAGRFPAADGGVTVVPQPNDRDAGVIGFAEALLWAQDPSVRGQRRVYLGDPG